MGPFAPGLLCRPLFSPLLHSCPVIAFDLGDGCPFFPTSVPVLQLGDRWIQRLKSFLVVLESVVSFSVAVSLGADVLVFLWLDVCSVLIYV